MTDLTEEQIETITEERKVVYALSWDGGTPMGECVETIYEYNGKLYTFLSWEDGDGPYPLDSLFEIIESKELLTITSAVTGVYIANVTEAKEAEIVKLASIQAEAGHKIEIHGKLWQVNENNQLVKI